MLSFGGLRSLLAQSKMTLLGIRGTRVLSKRVTHVIEIVAAGSCTSAFTFKPQNAFLLVIRFSWQHACVTVPGDCFMTGLSGLLLDSDLCCPGRVPCLAACMRS